MHTATRHKPLSAYARGRARHPRGIAMVLVLGALAAVTVITLTFLSGQTTSLAIAHNANRQTQARGIAEDGLAVVLAHVRGDEDWRDGQTHGVWSDDQDLNGGVFRVLFEDQQDTELGDDLADPFVVTVDGVFDGVVHRVSNLVTPSGVQDPITVMFISDVFQAQEDLERMATLESWGYTVVVVSDEDSQSELDAAAAQADVIYISEEVQSLLVNTRLSGYPIGIVNEEHALLDDLLASSGVSTYSGDTIEITDNSHPITAGFALGDLEIAGVTTQLHGTSGTLAPGLQALAQRIASSSAVLSFVELGDLLTDGNPSPQRRVVLPFGNDGFEHGDLNDNGLRLMRQAVEWAAATPDAELPDPVSRWTLDETSGTQAADAAGGRHGTYGGGVALGAEGQINGAAEFDGNDGFVEIPHHDDFLVDEGAISAWFYVDAVSGSQELFSKDSSGFDTGGHVRLFVEGSALQARLQSTDATHTLDSGSGLSAATWHHALLTLSLIHI